MRMISCALLVASFIILRPGEGLTSSTKKPCLTFLVKKEDNIELSGMSTFKECVKKKPLSQISFSWSSLNLKVSIDEETQEKGSNLSKLS